MRFQPILPIVAAMWLTLLWSFTTHADHSDEYLSRIVDLHQNSAPDAAHELQLVDELDELALAESDLWLADFWASYLLTQVVMSHAENRKDHIVRAQRHLNRAFDRAGEAAAAPLADLHALQSLVTSFSVSQAPSKQIADNLAAAAKLSLQRAIELEPESPVVMVMVGTDLIAAGQKAEDWPQVMGGLALLRQAENQFASMVGPKGTTTAFNWEWIPPWEGWVLRMYEGGFKAD